jgi:hypothetical protein
MMFSYRKIAVCLASAFFTALASAHFVKYSVAIMMYSFLLEEAGEI